MIGTVVATKKYETLSGIKLLVVETIENGKPAKVDHRRGRNPAGGTWRSGVPNRLEGGVTAVSEEDGAGGRGNCGVYRSIR